MYFKWFITMSVVISFLLGIIVEKKFTNYNSQKECIQLIDKELKERDAFWSELVKKERSIAFSKEK